MKKYLSLIKFSHTIFAMPFALIGFFIGIFELQELSIDQALLKLVLVILCMVFARSAAMSFNRFLDQDYDAKNPRTAIREIPAGIIQSKHALLFTIFSSLAFITTTYFINVLCFYLSFVALFVVLFYSYTKRFTALCHLVLGVGLSLAPIGAYLAIVGKFDFLPLLFSFIVLFWVSGFDIIYALQDEEFDKNNKLHSIPALFGKKSALLISRLFHLLAAILVIYAGLITGFGLWYTIGLIVFCGMLVYQQSIVKPNDLSRVNLAFMTANGFASVVFSIFVIIDLFLKYKM